MLCIFYHKNKIRFQNTAKALFRIRFIALKHYQKINQFRINKQASIIAYQRKKSNVSLKETEKEIIKIIAEINEIKKQENNFQKSIKPKSVFFKKSMKLMSLARQSIKKMKIHKLQIIVRKQGI